MAEEKVRNGNGYTKIAIAALVSALATGFLSLLLNSKADQRTIAQLEESVKDLQKRVMLVETNRASDYAQLQGLVEKVNQIYQVTVLGERVRPR